MEILHEITENKNIAVALGYFDGIHIGHRKILQTLIQNAKAMGIKCAVVTFEDNPANHLKNEKTLNIQTYKDREIILASLGVDYLYELDFEKYKHMQANEYLKDVIVKYLKPKLIVVGYNHTFGKNKEGNPNYLQEFKNLYNYECIVMPEVLYHDKEPVSSSIIRKRIEYGHLNAIKAFLGRYFSVRNSVVKGARVASSLGYPTANLVWPDSMVKLPYGVYHGFAMVDRKMYPALISWGVKPTLTQGKNEILEVHLYNFNENLYGKIINVLFSKKVRDEEKFGNILVLKTQLQKDYAAFKRWARLVT